MGSSQLVESDFGQVVPQKTGKAQQQHRRREQEKDSTMPVKALPGWVTVSSPELEMKPVTAKINPTTAGPSARDTVSAAAQTR